MPDDGPDTILLDLFRTNQARERLIESALEGVDLPPEDYPFYVLIGAEGPWTPTALAARYLDASGVPAMWELAAMSAMPTRGSGVGHDVYVLL